MVAPRNIATASATTTITISTARSISHSPISRRFLPTFVPVGRVAGPGRHHPRTFASGQLAVLGVDHGDRAVHLVHLDLVTLVDHLAGHHGAGRPALARDLDLA